MMRRLVFFCISGMIFLCISGCRTALSESSYYQETEPWQVNYDETRVPPYELPDLLLCRDGRRIRTSEEWLKYRRPELLGLFQKIMYGEEPPYPDRVQSRVLSEKRNALDGKAVRREVRLTLIKGRRSHNLDLLYYIPAGATEKVPVFIGLTFAGNHAVSPETDIRMTGLAYDDYGVLNRKRGSQQHRFPLKQILGRGYAVAVASYHDLFPDHKYGWSRSIYTLFPELKQEMIVPECRGSLHFPEQWRIFTNVSPEFYPDTAVLKSLPEQLDGRTGKTVRLNNGKVDFGAFSGRKGAGVCNWAFARLDVPAEGIYTLGAGADWWMKYFVNGVAVMDTGAAGNEASRFSAANHTAQVHLQKGCNILAVRCISGISSSVLCLGGPDELRRLSDQGIYWIQPPRPAGYSSIGAWAWGISRMLDYLCTVPEIDGARAAVFGHSRLGKAALWTGALDTRFKLVCVNDSGCGGAALSRRLYGETLYSMYSKTGVGEWWLTDSLKEKALHPEKLPLDQHALIALVAPRAVAVHSATADQWADPKSEYLGAFHAGKVFRLFGRKILESEHIPPPDQPVGSDVSYLLRTGGHNLLLQDWEHYLDMADRIFR